MSKNNTRRWSVLKRIPTFAPGVCNRVVCWYVCVYDLHVRICIFFIWSRYLCRHPSYTCTCLHLYFIYIYICRYYEKRTRFKHDLYIIELDHWFFPKSHPRCLKYSHCFRECSSQKRFQASPKIFHHKPFQSKWGCQFWHHKIWHAI